MACASGLAACRAGSGDKPAVVYDLAAQAYAADLEFPRKVVLFGTPAAAPHEGVGFRRAAPDGSAPRAALLREAEIEMRWPAPEPRTLLLDLAPASARATRAELWLNGRRLGHLRLGPGRSRHLLDLPVASQKRRRNRLRLRFGGAARGQERARTRPAAHLYAMALAPRDDRLLEPLADARWAPLEASARGGVPRLVQAAPGRLTYVIRVPTDGELRFRPEAAGGGGVALRVTVDDGTGPRLAWSDRLEPGPPRDEVRVPLPQAGRLVRLALEARPAQPRRLSWTAWVAPRVVGRGAPDFAADARAAPRSRERLAASLRDAHVVLVVLDAAGAGHFSCYGRARRTTPHADRLAAEGVLFERAYTTAPFTRAAMASLWTSQYPDRNRSGLAHDRALPPERLRVAQVLAAHGIHGAGFVANAHAGGSWGFEAGFAEFHDLYEGAGLAPAPRVQAAFDRFLSRRGEGRFFASLHLKEPHFPYDPPPPFSTMFLPPGAVPLAPQRAWQLVHTPGPADTKPGPEPAERPVLEAMYDGNLAYGDQAVGWVRERLERAGLWERTVVILTSDHGEAMGEHGFVGHTPQVYEESIRVPMILRLPEAAGLSGRRVRELVDLVDLGPTILDLFGLRGRGGSGREFRGHSLLEVALGSPGKGFTVARSAYDPPVYAFQDGRWKLLYQGHPGRPPTVELYDLERDPGETTDLSGRDPLRTDYYRQSLQRWLLSLRPDGAAGARAELSPEARENLRALGYAQ